MRTLSPILTFLFFAFNCFSQKSSDTTFQGWPEKIKSITYRTNGIADKLLIFHENGKLKSEWNYKNGKVQGEVITYDNNGNLKSKINYRDDQMDGEARFFLVTGKISSAGQYKNGKPDGIWKSFDSLGMVVIESDNKGDQRVTKHFKNGKISSLEASKNNLREDTSYMYYPNGTIKFRGCFKKGRPYGLRLYYSENGSLLNGNAITLLHENGAKEREGNFIDGKPEGEMKVYSGNNKLTLICNFKNGLMYGISTAFDNNGKVRLKDKYKNGKFVKTLKPEEYEKIEVVNH
jgi:uncharacterized protein